MKSQFRIFCDEYRKQLHIAMRDHPDEYVPGINADTVASRMELAFANGTYDHDGRAVKATCKVLGIKHTRKAIDTFLKGQA